MPSLSETFKGLLPIAHEWKNIGVLLEMESHILDKIQSNEQLQGVQNCLREMYVVNKPTFLGLSAVKPFNEHIAERLDSKFGAAKFNDHT